MGFFQDLKNGDIKSIILVIFGILFFNLYWCMSRIQCQCKNKEPMADLSTDVKQAVKQVYLADVQAIRNLSEVATKLQRDGLTIPGDLTVTGKFNYLPKGSIIAFNSTTAPTGWTLCDGSNGSPDLRGRFVLGSGKGDNLTERKLDARGGEENITLNIDQMPKHNHNVKGDTGESGKHNHKFKVGGGDGGGGGGNGTSEGYTNHGNGYDTYTFDNEDHYHSIDITSTSEGGGKPHNNMPPFYVLTYIMKL